MKADKLFRVTFGLALALTFAAPLQAENQIPVAAPMTTELAGRTASVAVPSVFRVLIPCKNSSGTAFLHRSGKLITVAHVVKDVTPQDIILIDARAARYAVTNIVSDPDLDLALLCPKQKIGLPSLDITTEDRFAVGLQVSTWGYPGGYNGLPPLLMSGYLSGLDFVETESGKRVARWVVNAAFNNGNSGGPLVEIEKGRIIGVVSSKLAPLPRDIDSALKALKTQRSGAQYQKKTPDGKTEAKSEAQLLEEVLQYLRGQTQLVVGYAVLAGDLKTFLLGQGIDP